MNSCFKVLLAAELPQLEEALRQNGYEVIKETNPVSAGNRLTQEWLHLAIIQLPPADNSSYATWLNLAMQTGILMPKVILSSQPLDEMSKTVRQALASVDHPAPSVAFLAQTEGWDIVVNTVSKVITKYLGINRQLSIQPGPHVFYNIAGWLMPNTELSLWIGELEDLFRILFQDCTQIKIELKDHLSRKLGEICTVWVEPASETVPMGHPVLVKCGLRETIEKARENYERYFFRITPTRLAGFARTTHFAAAALPAPTDRYDVIDNFPSFYRRKSEDEVCQAITNIMQRCKRWNKQVTLLPDPWHNNLRVLYLNRLGLRNQEKVRNKIQELIQLAQNHGLLVDQRGEEIGFRFTPTQNSEFYPNPLPYLYGDRKSLELTPSQLYITHGDLRDENLCLDIEGVVWLDGYESMDLGPAVTDAAGLEATLKFRCSENTWTLRQLYALEKIALSPTRFNESMPTVPQPDEMQKLLRVIAHLRNRWAGALSGSDLKEYYASLFFFTMRELVTEETSAQPQMADKRQLHALLSAAMICYRVEHWEDFDKKGWPGPKEVLPMYPIRR